MVHLNKRVWPTSATSVKKKKKLGWSLGNTEVRKYCLNCVFESFKSECVRAKLEGKTRKAQKVDEWTFPPLLQRVSSLFFSIFYRTSKKN